MGTTTREERPGRRAWLGDEVDRLIAWMRTKFADARLDDGAGEAAAVIRLLERERQRLAHEARRQATRRNGNRRRPAQGSTL